jgi:flagellar hook-basal body complex protein FliE
MNPVGGIGNVSGIWGPAAGQHTRPASTPALRDLEPQRGIALQSPSGSAPAPSFSETLSQVLGEVNGLQQKADSLVARLAAGDIENVHDVIIAQQEAAIAFRLIQEVRDKLVAAYQELMRMQV